MLLEGLLAKCQSVSVDPRRPATPCLYNAETGDLVKAILWRGGDNNSDWDVLVASNAHKAQDQVDECSNEVGIAVSPVREEPTISKYSPFAILPFPKSAPRRKPRSQNGSLPKLHQPSGSQTQSSKAVSAPPGNCAYVVFEGEYLNPSCSHSIHLSTHPRRGAQLACLLAFWSILLFYPSKMTAGTDTQTNNGPNKHTQTVLQNHANHIISIRPEWQ